MRELSSSARRQPNVKARREEVLDEASRLLNANGVSQTTLQDLANVLGVTRNALYYYFKDIEDLIFQVYRRSCEILAGHLAEATESGGSALDILQDFVTRCLDSDQPEMAALNEYGLLQPPTTPTSSASMTTPSRSCRVCWKTGRVGVN